MSSSGNSGNGVGALLFYRGKSSREGICTSHFPAVECLKCWGVCKKLTKHPRPLLGMLVPLTIHREQATPTAVQRSRWSREFWQRTFCWQCLPRHPLPQSRGVAVACLISYIFFLIWKNSKPVCSNWFLAMGTLNLSVKPIPHTDLSSNPGWNLCQVDFPISP